MMNGKRDRSPPPSAGESPKVCLICSSKIRDDKNPNDLKGCVYAFIVDPNSQTADSDTITDADGFILNSQPAVRFDGIADGEFCVSKSTLYIIESEHESPPETFREAIYWSKNPRTFRCGSIRLLRMEESCRLELIAAIPVTKTVYSFDLAQCQSSSEMKVVQKSELQKLPDMLGGKLQAKAVVTPEGKILVFSSSVTREFADSPQMVEAELYDPDTQVWTKFPPLYDHIQKYPSYQDRKDLTICTYGFLTSSVYFVRSSHGQHAIDLGSEEEEKCWRKHELFSLKVWDIHFIVEEGVCLTPYGIKSLRDWTTLGKYPPLTSFPDQSLYEGRIYLIRTQNRYSVLLGKVEGGGCFEFCSSIRAWHRYHEGGFMAFFILDVFSANKFSADKFIISRKRSLRFSSRRLGRLSISGLFSVQFST